MIDAETFRILSRWPAADPGVIQLYAQNTPNGVKVSILLEELGLPYEPHLVRIGRDESHTPEFLSLNPNGKIPAIIDPDGPGGAPIGLFESGAILIYLADKAGRFTGPDAATRWRAIQWVMWQMGGLGPMFGQVGFFHKFAGAKWEDKRPLERYLGEAKRLLGVLDRQLDGREWITGSDYTIADIACVGWINGFLTVYKAGDLVGFEAFGNVRRWFDATMARPAVQRGLTVCAVPADG